MVHHDRRAAAGGEGEAAERPRVELMICNGTSQGVGTRPTTFNNDVLSHLCKQRGETNSLLWEKKRTNQKRHLFLPSDCCLVWTLGNFCLYGHVAGNIMFSRYDLKFTLLWTSKEGEGVAVVPSLSFS